MAIRPATHAGSWYSNDKRLLLRQLEKYFGEASSLSTGLSGQPVALPIKGARVLIGPHAGYLYLGKQLAETFNVWDTSKVKRVFVLGPSHHVYFANSALVSGFEAYETPLGNLPVDTDTIGRLVKVIGVSGKPVFQYMSEEVDEDEHLFEMHAPFIYHRTHNLPQGVPKIIPIMISGLGDKLRTDIVDALRPYFADDENTFVISSDFCHWGPRFGYTQYVPEAETHLGKGDITTLRSGASVSRPIHQSIEILDKEAMRIASSGDYSSWKQYIDTTGNTICGQKPIGIVLGLLDRQRFEWIGYSQSSHVTRYDDTSVSYASGYVRM